MRNSRTEKGAGTVFKGLSIALWKVSRKAILCSAGG